MSMLRPARRPCAAAAWEEGEGGSRDRKWTEAEKTRTQDAGRKATQKMKDAGGNVLDKSDTYTEYKDFSEFWSALKKPP